MVELMLIFMPIYALFQYWYISVPAIIISIVISQKIPGFLLYALAAYHIGYGFYFGGTTLGFIIMAVWFFIWISAPRFEPVTTTYDNGRAAESDSYNYDYSEDCPYCGSGDSDGNHCGDCGEDY